MAKKDIEVILDHKDMKCGIIHGGAYDGKLLAYEFTEAVHSEGRMRVEATINLMDGGWHKVSTASEWVKWPNAHDMANHEAVRLSKLLALHLAKVQLEQWLNM